VGKGSPQSPLATVDIVIEADGATVAFEPMMVGHRWIDEAGYTARPSI
jgi:hypothetical protein